MEDLHLCVFRSNFINKNDKLIKKIILIPEMLLQEPFIQTRSVYI